MRDCEAEKNHVKWFKYDAIQMIALSTKIEIALTFFRISSCSIYQIVVFYLHNFQTKNHLLLMFDTWSFFFGITFPRYIQAFVFVLFHVRKGLENKCNVGVNFFLKEGNKITCCGYVEEASQKPMKQKNHWVYVCVPLLMKFCTQ